MRGGGQFQQTGEREKVTFHGITADPKDYDSLHVKIIWNKTTIFVKK